MLRIASAIALTGAVLASPLAAQQLPATKLNVVGNLGITTQYKDRELPFWTKTIPEASGGKVTAQIKSWSEMGMKGPEVFRLLQQGMFNIATAQMGHMAGDAAINDATDIAGLSPTMATFKQVTESFRPSLEKYYAQRMQIRLLGLWSFQAQVLYCRDEIRNLSDLKGRKVRTSGASQSDFVAHFGGSGVPVAFGEVQQALVKGVIDCAITGTVGGYSAKWYEGANQLGQLGECGQRQELGRTAAVGSRFPDEEHQGARGLDLGTESGRKRYRPRLQHRGDLPAGQARQHEAGQYRARRREAAP
jgi:TRAP-type C4-dicarboxylate transport system substrate-binding protein